MLKELEIIKFPYLGYSPNLIEYFLIIGHEKNFIKHEILPNYFTDQKKIYEPTILNSINSNSDIDMLDNDMIIKLIYPKTPQILSTTNLTYEYPTSSIIFFLNADTIGVQSKVPFHGCAFLFHEYFVINSTKIFIPKAFCIISQYPYFSLFNTINREILNSFRSKNDIPLEIVIYNMLNFIPSPINFSMNINTFPNKDNLYGNLSQSMTTNFTGSFHKSLNNSSIQTGSIVQLNGYPILDFNISEIFNILPMSMVVEVLIFNFLEFDMLFFSKNLEILNFTMYIIATLNYPCNDSIYQWHILSVSQEELLSSDTSQFVGKPWAAMMGVNCTYNNTIDSCKVVDSHFIVDLDNKNFFFKYTENNEDVVKANTLLAHIRKIMKDYNMPSLFLLKNIKQLLKELDTLSKQVVIHSSSSSNNITNNLNQNESSYSLHNSANNLQSIYLTNFASTHNFFETGDKVKILNKNIQEAFYDFILNILIVFYNNYFLNSSFDKKKVEGQPDTNFFIHYNEDTSKLSKEEKIFYDFFKSSNKYNNYILNFIQEFKCINLYKVPLIFSEEFIYLKKNNEDKIFKSRFFEIIENFYNENNFLGKKPINVNFTQFYSYYESYLKTYFYDEISNFIPQDSVIKYFRFGNSDKLRYTYEYEIMELENEVLLRYIYHLNNLTDEFKEEIFPSIGFKKTNEIKTVKYYEIVDIIEKNLITHKILKSENLIIFSLIFIFIITRSRCNFNESISHLRDILELLDSKSFFLRKYINLILGIYNNYGDNSINDNKNPKIIKSLYINKMCNFIIINFLRNKNILPNELMMKLFENFTVQSEKEDDDFNMCDSLLEEEDEANSSMNDLEKFNIFLTYHFCGHGLKKADYFIKQGENTSYDGDLFIECCSNPNKTCICFKFDFSNKILTSEIFSPLKLYNLAQKVFNNFMEHHNFELLDKELINKVIINLIFYCKNTNMTYKFLLKFLNI